MSLLQEIIIIAISVLFTLSLIKVGTFIQDNLIFEKYEDRFTAHGLVIKAFDALIIVSSLAIGLIVWIKFSYIYNSNIASIFGALNSESFLNITNNIQVLITLLDGFSVCAWFILIFIYTTPKLFFNFTKLILLKMKGEA